MPPLSADVLLDLSSSALTRRNNTTTTPSISSKSSRAWNGGVSVSSVDLIAMIVSDAGLQNAEPQWWNASPLGCLLIGIQPRGGWQIIQRAVQWGNDFWANCFGVKCEMSVVYQYFACSMRNRLEVWDSDDFYCPMIDYSASESGSDDKFPLDPKAYVGEIRHESTGSTISPAPTAGERHASTLSARSKDTGKPSSSSKHWRKIKVSEVRLFDVRRPTKLVDGSRGGQAFICELLLPEPGKAYGIEEQAKMQFLSIVLVAASLINQPALDRWRLILQENFQLDDKLGIIFRHLLRGLAAAQVILLGLILTTCYALWARDIYGHGAPYMIQIASMLSWAFGAIGLLMLGGNPRVRIRKDSKLADRFKARLYGEDEPTEEDFKKRGSVRLRFGSLHGSIYTQDGGNSYVPFDIVEEICSWDLRLVRTRLWMVGMVWFLLFLGVSIILQIAGSLVNTVYSEILSVIFLIVMSVVRGQGLSGSEKRMIPKWKMRQGVEYAVPLVGQLKSRRGAEESTA